MKENKNWCLERSHNNTFVDFKHKRIRPHWQVTAKHFFYKEHFIRCPRYYCIAGNWRWLIYLRKDFICFDWCAIEYWAFSVFVNNESSLSSPLDIFCCISCCDGLAATLTGWLASASTCPSPVASFVSGVSSPSAPPFIFSKLVKLPHAFYMSKVNEI